MGKELRKEPSQRERLVRTRKQLEAHGRSLMVNHGFESISKWWKARTFTKLAVPAWLKELLGHTQPILLSLEAQIRALAAQLEASALPGQPKGLGALSSVVIDREVGDWHRFQNRRQPASDTGLCPGEWSRREASDIDGQPERATEPGGEGVNTAAGTPGCKAV